MSAQAQGSIQVLRNANASKTSKTVHLNAEIRNVSASTRDHTLQLEKQAQESINTE